MNENLKRAVDEAVGLLKLRKGTMPLHSSSFEGCPLVNQYYIETLNVLHSLHLAYKDNKKLILTEKGWKFNGFDAYESSNSEDQEHQKRQRSLTKWELRKAKYWWIIAIIGAIIGFFVEKILTILYSHGSQP